MMNSISNKENIKNLSRERAPLQAIKSNDQQLKNSNNILNNSNNSSIGLVKPQSQGFASPVVNNSQIQLQQQQQINELRKKLKELEESLVAKDQIIYTLQDLNDQSQDPVTKKQTNNRIRKIQQLTLENSTLKEQLQNFEFIQQKNDKVTTMLNNNRIRTIQKLTKDNKSLKEENDKLKAHLKHHQHQPLVNTTTTTTGTTNNNTQSIRNNVVNGENSFHYHNSTQVSTYRTTDYGNDNQYEHVGEC